LLDSYSIIKPEKLNARNKGFTNTLCTNYTYINGLLNKLPTVRWIQKKHQGRQSKISEEVLILYIFMILNFELSILIISTRSPYSTLV
jgi:hypothetical protein